MATILTVDKCDTCGARLVDDTEHELVKCPHCGWAMSYYSYEMTYTNPYPKPIKHDKP